MRLLLIVGAFFVAILAAVIVAPVLMHSGCTNTREAVSMSNLYQIGIAMHGYAEEFGSYPQNLPTLDAYCEGLGQVLVSPRDPFRAESDAMYRLTQSGEAPSGADLDAMCSYAILKWGQESTESHETPLAYEKLIREEKEAIVLFDDGSVRFVRVAGALELIRESGHEPVWAD